MYQLANIHLWLILLGVIGGFTLLLFLIIMVRRWFFNKIETIVHKRLNNALKVKDIAMRISSNFNDNSIIMEEPLHPLKTLKYSSVTILFADIQGFTKIVEKSSPEKLIDELDNLFIHFDIIIGRHGVEKIKTIGDAYMAASGIPKKSSSHAIEMVMAAMEIQQYMEALKAEKIRKKQEYWEIRIGIDTGPVIAGRLNQKRTNFDVWGDTVNTASRMESSSLPGKINITDTTYQIVKEFFVCEHRGQMPVKYKGMIDMYFVTGIRAELSEDGLGLKPNKEFQTHLQMVRFIQMEKAVLDRLDKELPANMHYHNSRHTMDVLAQVEVIAQNEGVSNEELLLLKTAALLHDTGYLIDYENHEFNSTIIATDVLKAFDYSEQQIKEVNKLILATHSQHTPTNLLEMIIKDADVDHLGRSDFLNLSKLLYLEQHHHRGTTDLKAWKKKQLNFLDRHIFYTDSEKKIRQKIKLQHKQNLKSNMDH